MHAVRPVVAGGRNYDGLGRDSANSAELVRGIWAEFEPESAAFRQTQYHTVVWVWAAAAPKFSARRSHA